MTHLSCDQLRSLVCEPISDTQAAWAELHLEHCDACREFLFSAEHRLDAFDEKLRRGNAEIALPYGRAAEILAAATDASAASASPNSGNDDRSGRTSSLVYAVVAVAASLLAVAGWWQASKPTDSSYGLVEQAESPTKRPGVSDGSEAGRKPQPATTDASLVIEPEPTVSLFVRDGFMVADKHTDPGEIPFFWVLPGSGKAGN